MAATKTKPGNFNREIYERREKPKDGEISGGDAPSPLKLRRTGENAERRRREFGHERSQRSQRMDEAQAVRAEGDAMGNRSDFLPVLQSRS